MLKDRMHWHSQHGTGKQYFLCSTLDIFYHKFQHTGNFGGSVYRAKAMSFCFYIIPWNWRPALSESTAHSFIFILSNSDMLNRNGPLNLEWRKQLIQHRHPWVRYNSRSLYCPQAAPFMSFGAVDEIRVGWAWWSSYIIGNSRLQVARLVCSNSTSCSYHPALKLQNSQTWGRIWWQGPYLLLPLAKLSLIVLCTANTWYISAILSKQYNLWSSDVNPWSQYCKADAIYPITPPGCLNRLYHS